MDIYFKIIKGPRQGDLFKIQNGATLGRSRADINLKDPKASSLHALIESEMGSFYLIDKDSSNGTLVNGLREDRIELKPGTSLTIGSTTLEVQTQFQVKANDSTMSFWREDLYTLVQSAASSQNSQALHPFPQMIQICITQGLQEGTVWDIGYGPRHFGAEVSDFTLLDPGAPPLAFEIYEKEGHIFVETLYKEIVLIGIEKKDSEKIYDGLEIKINNTVLEIKIVDSNS